MPEADLMISLATELTKIRGLRPYFLERLRTLRILTVRDLLFHFPTRYDDFSAILPIAELVPKIQATVCGEVKKITSRHAWRRNMTVIEAIIADDSGGVRVVWFNQAYIAHQIRVGLTVRLAGRVSQGKDGIYFSSPAYEVVHSGDAARHTSGLIPIYPETKGLTSRGLRYLIQPLLSVLDAIPDPIPYHVLARQKLPILIQALSSIHFPKTLDEAKLAERRFAFEDLFLIQIMNARRRLNTVREKALSLAITPEQRAEFLSALPFRLTEGQITCWQEILTDIGRQFPMQRLLQGDVGSGKTVLAAGAAWAAFCNGAQTVFLAPTEILARQHHETLSLIFKSSSLQFRPRIGLLLGSHTATLKRDTKQGGAKGRLDILVGTHALLQGDLAFHRLALVVVDEQHRFGVRQRAALLKSQDFMPHFLSMTATPIPRTLSLTVFGDLDISTLRELPQGRKKIVTKVVDPKNRDKAYAFIREELRRGRQAFVVCPRIEEAETSTNGASHLKIATEIKTVTAEYQRLAKDVFSDFSVAMLHGRLSTKEKSRIMADFALGAISVLVATSVVEVGVNVPNASVMVIESADFFGLAQLYQFRGRIGRGEHQSYCLLFTESQAATARDRLGVLIKAKNGFELAEMDLQIRGPGEFLGDEQTGFPDYAMRAMANLELVGESKREASLVLSRDPELASQPLLRERLKFFEAAVHFE